MGAIVVYQYHSVLRCPNFFSFSTRPKLGKPSFCFKDMPPSHLERKGLHLTVSCIGSDEDGGNQPPRRRSKNDGTKRRGSGGRRSKSTNQEEIISLFRRIQTSISNEESVTAKKINSNPAEDSPSSSASILGALRGSRMRSAKATDKEAEKILTRGVDAEAQQEFKLTRPPSNFVKGSPIPSPSIPAAKIIELNSEASPSAPGTEEFDFIRVEAMKLPELKELAKSRGIKGYSKLKKSELVQLLKS